MMPLYLCNHEGRGLDWAEVSVGRGLWAEVSVGRGLRYSNGYIGYSFMGFTDLKAETRVLILSFVYMVGTFLLKYYIGHHISDFKHYNGYQA